MNQHLQKDIIRWDIASWSEALDFWEKNVDGNTAETALELGGREGGLSLWLALKGIRTVCSDLENVESTAKPLHAKHGVLDHIFYQNIDATDIPYENHFDLVLFKSILGGIGRDGRIEKQRKVLNEIYKSLKPGGKLLFAENLTGSFLHRQMRKRFVKWGSAWRYISIEEMKEFLREFSNFEVKTNGVMATFGRSENQRNALAKADKALLNQICPNHWKYICYGVAVK